MKLMEDVRKGLEKVCGDCSDMNELLSLLGKGASYSADCTDDVEMLKQFHREMSNSLRFIDHAVKENITHVLWDLLGLVEDGMEITYPLDFPEEESVPQNPENDEKVKLMVSMYEKLSEESKHYMAGYVLGGQRAEILKSE